MEHRIEAAKKFFAELLDSVETLTGIGEEYGAQTLAELMYLHAAIMEGSFIYVDPDDETATFGILEGLPSYAQWIGFVKTPFDEDFSDALRKQAFNCASLTPVMPLAA